MSRRKQRRKQKAPPGMGLVPFMNLILILIPALLLSASFAQLAVIDATQTTPEAPCETSPEEPVDLALRVRVDDEGFTVMSRAEGDEATHRIVLDPGAGHPYGKLSLHLRGLKAAYPGARQVTLSADPTVPYWKVIRTMDATREDEAGLLFPDLALTPSP